MTLIFDEFDYFLKAVFTAVFLDIDSHICFLVSNFLDFTYALDPEEQLIFCLLFFLCSHHYDFLTSLLPLSLHLVNLEVIVSLFHTL